MTDWFDDDDLLDDYLKRAAEKTLQMPTIPGYSKLQLVSTGGQGHVYRAIQEESGQRVAIKSLRGRSLASRTGKQRMELEIRVLESLNHPRILPILDTAADLEGNPALVTQWMHGGTFAAHLPFGRRGGESISLHEGVRALIDVGEALAHAHEQSIVHRDVKPSNLLFDKEGNLHVADFGLARVLGAGQHEPLTISGMILGSLAYVAPELLQREPAVHQGNDIFGLAGVLYEGLCGKPPHPLRGNARLRHVPPLPRKHAGEAVERLHDVAMHGLADSAADRYPSMEPFLEDLQAWLDGKQPQAPRYGAWKRFRYWLRSAETLPTPD